MRKIFFIGIGAAALVGVSVMLFGKSPSQWLPGLLVIGCLAGGVYLLIKSRG